MKLLEEIRGQSNFLYVLCELYKGWYLGKVNDVGVNTVFNDLGMLIYVIAVNITYTRTFLYTNDACSC